MTCGRHLSRFFRDSRGAAVVEFAIIGPALIMMLMGVLMVGLHMKAYNSVRSIVYDVNRYTVVEYQKSNKMDASQIEQVATALARRSPYELSDDEIEVSVVEEESGIAGAKKFTLTLSYIPPAISGILGVHPPKIVQTQSIIVPE